MARHDPHAVSNLGKSEAVAEKEFRDIRADQPKDDRWVI
jgi:hypothetical protein